MSLRVSNLRLSLDEPEAALPAHLARALGLAPEALRHWRILRKSLDARDKDELHFVYTAEVQAAEDEARLVELARRRRSPVRVDHYDEPAFRMPPPGTR